MTAAPTFSDGLTVQRSVLGIVTVRHDVAKLEVSRTAERAFWGSASLSDAAREKELDRLEVLCREALRALYDHKYRPKGKR